MNLFTKQPKTVTTYSSEPYAYQPGFKYLLEVNAEAVSLHDIQELKEWFLDNGIICKIVATRNGRKALYPVVADYVHESKER